MQEADVVSDLLLPADQQAPCPVEPRVGAFHLPATCLPAMAFPFGLLPALDGNVRRETTTAHETLNGFADIRFVQTEMLTFASRGPRTPDGYAVDRFLHELMVMHNGSSDR